MAINLSVQYHGGSLPDITLLTQGYHHWGTLPPSRSQRTKSQKRGRGIDVFARHIVIIHKQPKAFVTNISILESCELTHFSFFPQK